MTLVHSEKLVKIKYDNKHHEIPAGVSEQEHGLWRYARSKGHAIREATVADEQKAAGDLQTALFAVEEPAKRSHHKKEEPEPEKGKSKKK